MTEKSWVDSPRGQESHFSSNPTRPAPGPTQSHISWILGAEAWSWPISSFRYWGQEWMELALHSPHAFMACVRTTLLLLRCIRLNLCSISCPTWVSISDKVDYVFKEHLWHFLNFYDSHINPSVCVYCEWLLSLSTNKCKYYTDM
jgi:hypothetical protein